MTDMRYALADMNWQSNDLFADFEADAAEDAAAKKVEREGKMRMVNKEQDLVEVKELEVEEVEGRGEDAKEMKAKEVEAEAIDADEMKAGETKTDEKIRLLLSLIDQVRPGFLKSRFTSRK